MARIEDLAEIYSQHIATPWQRTIAGANRIILVVYDKELERSLRARRTEFETRTRAAGHDWYEVDLTDCFAAWLAADEYREAYFASPDRFQMKLDAEFPEFAADRIRRVLARGEVGENAVVGVWGVGSLFGFAHVSHVLSLVEHTVRGRLAVFFPGHYEQSNYRLLDARDGWNYMAVPITMHGTGSSS